MARGNHVAEAFDWLIIPHEPIIKGCFLSTSNPQANQIRENHLTPSGKSNVRAQLQSATRRGAATKRHLLAASLSG